jgi:hypothetical protein
VSNALWWRPGHDEQLIFRATTRGRSFEPALYRIGYDGSGLERITALGTNEYQYQDITLSADGRTAAYWSWEADDSGDKMGGYLHTLDLETGGEIAHELSAEKWIRPQFSPDGRTLAVMTNVADTQRVAVGTLDSEPRIVGPVIKFDTAWSFMFSPDGTKLAVNVEGEETWLVDVATGGEGTPLGIDYFAGWQRLAR